jgi:hypothetical protein
VVCCSLLCPPENEAQKSAEQWLSLIDAGKFAESWTTAAEYFQAAVSQEQWERSPQAIRQPLGDLVSRKLKSAKYITSGRPRWRIRGFEVRELIRKEEERY